MVPTLSDVLLQAAEYVDVVCGGRTGKLYLSTGKINADGKEVTATAFEKACGKGANKNWKRSVHILKVCLTVLERQSRFIHRAWQPCLTPQEQGMSLVAAPSTQSTYRLRACIMITLYTL